MEPMQKSIYKEGHGGKRMDEENSSEEWQSLGLAGAGVQAFMLYWWWIN